MSIKAMVWVEEHAPISGGAYFTLMGLANWADDDGVTRFGASRAALARWARLSERQCQRVLARLEAHGMANALRGGAGRGQRVQWRVVMDIERWSDEMRELAKAFLKGDMASPLVSDLTLSTTPRKGDMMSPFRRVQRETSATKKGDASDMERETSATYPQAVTKSLISVRTVRSVRARVDARIGPIASAEKTEGKRSGGTEQSRTIVDRVVEGLGRGLKLGDGAVAGGVRSDAAADETALHQARLKAAERRWGAHS